MNQITLQIDGKQVIVDQGTTIIEAARISGIDIPSLCHDPRIEPFGACRLCFVNLKDSPKPVTACSTPVAEGMVVETEDQVLADLRKSALELLLSNHHGDCIAPCQIACPAHIDIQGFIAHIANDQYQEASKLIKEMLPFPSAVGRVCPRFCEEACRRTLVDEPIAICILKGFAGDQDLAAQEPTKPEVKADTGKRVAIIGGGPAGLSAAYYLRQEGHQVTLYEAQKALGGMMRYGIPEYRLPKKHLDHEIAQILALGIDVNYGVSFGKDITLQSLKDEGYDAIFVGIGCWENTQVDLPGKELPGVYSGIAMLRDVVDGQKVELGDRVAIMGGGNTAMDAARTAVRLGAKEVTVVYRRTEKEMPADPREVKDAKEEGVKFQFLTNPVAINGKDRIEGIRCVEMELGEPDASGRRRPVVKEGSEFDIPVDSLVLAIGQVVDQSALKGSETLDLDRWNCIAHNEKTMTTSLDGVFTAGDCAMGARTVVEAIGQARLAALAMNQYLAGSQVAAQDKVYNCSRGALEDIDPNKLAHIDKAARIQQEHLLPQDRKNNFKEVEYSLKPDKAMEESKRCLSCGCQDVFECRLRDLATRYGVEDETVIKFDYHHPIINEHDYIIRDADKCVLCGNCVRICYEVQGASALGFVARGMETVVMPALEEPLSQTTCESCGQCVSSCPTGALDVSVKLPKPGPWKTETVDTICPHCSVGCTLTVHLAGDCLVKVTTPLDASINKGNLCVKGSFEFSPAYQKGIHVEPLVKESGKQGAVSVKKAIEKAAQLLLQAKEKGNLAVLVSPKISSEAAYLAKETAALLGGSAAVMGAVSAPVETMLKNLTFASFDHIETSELIVLYKVNVADDYPVVAQRIRKALRKGAKLVVVDDTSTKFDRAATKKITKTTTDALKADPIYASAKNRYIIADQGTLTEDDVSFFSQSKDPMTVLSFGANYAGLRQLGIKSADDIMKQVADGSIKGILMVADEDGLVAELPANSDMLRIVIAPGLIADTEAIDVYLPGTTFAETRGTFINAEGKKQFADWVRCPVTGTETWDLLQQMNQQLGEENPPLTFDELRKKVDEQLI